MSVHSLARYVPRIGLRLLAEGPVPEAGRYRDGQAAALFADISGFTALVERTTTRYGDEGAELLQGLLNACFGPLVESVDRHGGEVLAFPGDAAICLWTVGESGNLARAVERAAQCAAQLREQLDGLASLAGVSLRIRCAVSAGAMQSALVGGVDGRWTPVVRGPVVDEVAAMIGEAAPREVLLSRSARQFAGDGFIGKARGRHWLLTQAVTPANPAPVDALPALDDGDVARLVSGSVLARGALDEERWLSEFRVITAVFITIKKPPADFGVLHETVRTIQSLIGRFDGELNQVVFDDKGLTAVAVFGLFQRSHENDGSRAVAAAIGIRDTLQSVGVDARLGIATGRAFTGVRGGGAREEFAVMGPVVVLAARLAVAARDILADATTQSSARASFAFEAAPPTALKGLGIVEGLGRPVGTSADTRSASATTLMGRTRERACIAARLSAFAAHGAGGALLISGEPGIGKSALMESVRLLAEQQGIECVAGAGDAIQPFTTFRAWRTMLAPLLADLGEAGDPTAQLVMWLGEEEREWFPLLSPVLPVNLPENASTARLSGESRAQTTRMLLVSLLRRLCDARRRMFVLEDAHWVDSASWELIEDALRRVPALMIAISTRLTPEIEPRLERLRESERNEIIALTPMAADEIGEMVCARVGAERLSDELARWIQQRCEGNPLFAIEIARMLMEQGTVAVRHGTCLLVEEGAARTLASLPDSVRGVLAVRIDRLAADDQLTVKVAAVLGREFDVDALRAISPLAEPADRLAGRIERLVATGLLVPPSGAPTPVTFSHALVQEVAYDLLTFAQRRSLHRSAAETFERQEPEPGPALVPLLAHHWERAAVAPKAMHYLELAGSHALLQTSSYPEAEQFFTRLVRLADAAAEGAAPAARPPDAIVSRASWERMLALSVSRQGNHVKALPHLHTALKILGQSSPSDGLAGVLELLGRLSVRMVLPVGWRGRTRAEHPNPIDVEAVHVYDSLVQVQYGGLGSGSARARAIFGPIMVLRACALSERLGPTGELSRAYVLLSLLIGLVGRPRLALAYAERAREIAEQINDPQALFRSLTMGQVAAFSSARWQQAERRLLEGQALGERLKNRHESLISACTLASISLHRGQHDAAMARFDEIRRKASDVSSLQPQLWAMAGIAELHLREGRLSDALDSARECLALADARKSTDLNCRFQVHGIVASVCAREGRIDEAMRAAELAMDACEKGARLSYSGQAGFAGVAEALVAACAAGGDHARLGEARLGPWLRQLRATAFARPLLAPLSLYCQAIDHRRRGQLAAARRGFAKAASRADALGMPYDAALARTALAAMSERA